MDRGRRKSVDDLLVCVLLRMAGCWWLMHTSDSSQLMWKQVYKSYLCVFVGKNVIDIIIIIPPQVEILVADILCAEYINSGVSQILDSQLCTEYRLSQLSQMFE